MPARKSDFTPAHFNATAADFAGNDGIGRYVFLPTSDGHAKEIAQYFENVSVKPHHRAHNLYLGTLPCDGALIEVAAISTGMGCPSTEVILHELFALGAKRFLRIGTAGSLQPELIKAGDLINVQASVRDECTTARYAPVGFPAIASLELTSSILLAAENIGLDNMLHTGIAHCKSSFYGGAKDQRQTEYLKLLSDTGVLVSEMESATIFIQSQIYNHQLQSQGNSPAHRVLAGAILSVLGDKSEVESMVQVKKSLKNSIELALEAVKTLATQELIQ
jgi:uridine phosphorylase